MRGAVPAHGRSGGPRPALVRVVPGRRPLLVLGGIALVAAVAFLLSMSTSVFAVRALEVSGGSPAVQAAVREALAEARGESLVGIDLDRLGGLVSALPSVAHASFDRAFPHTLRVRVVPERVVGVVRQGGAAYLVSARGRVVERVARTAAPALPRIWAGRSEALAPGGRVSPSLLPAVRAVAPLGQIRFPARVASVRTIDGEIRLKLRSGVDVRLGGRDDVTLKLAVAGRVLPLVAPDTTYLDVSVPERPVAGTALSDPLAPVATAPATTSTAVLASSGVTVATPLRLAHDGGAWDAVVP